MIIIEQARDNNQYSGYLPYYPHTKGKYTNIVLAVIVV